MRTARQGSSLEAILLVTLGTAISIGLAMLMMLLDANNHVTPEEGLANSIEAENEGVPHLLRRNP
jgi:hypothetical protein